MADSKREQIFKKVETLLKNIQGMKSVSRGKADLLGAAAYPMAFIYPGIDEVADENNTMRLRDMEVFIECWQMAQKDIHIEVEAFLPKVQRAIAADYTLSGSVQDFSETGVSGRLFTEDQTEGGFIIQCACKYRTLRSDPYS